jgi:hypothetical protein
MPKSQGAVSPLRIATSRQEALYRGYRIEGGQKGECLLLQVIPTRPDLPTLSYSQFKSLPHCTWPKAVEIVCGYIDQDFGDRASPLRPVPEVENQVEEQRPKFRLE